MVKYGIIIFVKKHTHKTIKSNLQHEHALHGTRKEPNYVCSANHPPLIKKLPIYFMGTFLTYVSYNNKHISLVLHCYHNDAIKSLTTCLLW